MHFMVIWGWMTNTSSKLNQGLTRLLRSVQVSCKIFMYSYLTLVVSTFYSFLLSEKPWPVSCIFSSRPNSHLNVLKFQRIRHLRFFLIINSRQVKHLSLFILFFLYVSDANYYLCMLSLLSKSFRYVFVLLYFNQVEIINDLPADKTITVYRCGPLVDLCRGPHIPNTSFVKAFACLKVCQRVMFELYFVKGRMSLSLYLAYEFVITGFFSLLERK